MMTVLGEWRDVLDVFTRILPAGSIIAAILLGRRQLKSSRQATAITIAKTHYREFITLALYNADIVARGATPESLTELRKDPASYRRYRWLATQALFALQEIYFAVPNNKEWQRTITVVASNFKAFILSYDHLPLRQREGWNPSFIDYLTTSLADFVAPILDLAVPLGEADELDPAFVPPIGMSFSTAAARLARPQTTCLR